MNKLGRELFPRYTQSQSQSQKCFIAIQEMYT